ncbi:hypothetical protein [Actinomyces oris]|uniref:hypothetical protein n=1 Tax=Actinomyces oris TaxID=544580 RepID=UPI000B2FDE80|nr:hypothetical protein [Actinomyces oris]
MKPQPRPRRTPNVPKAVGPDPAALTASQAANASITSNDGKTSNSGNDGGRDGTDAPVLKKITVRIPIELAGRARTVWRLENAQPGSPVRPYHELIAAWIEAGVIQAEERLNDGQPLPPTPTGQIPRGRQPSQ